MVGRAGHWMGFSALVAFAGGCSVLVDSATGGADAGADAAVDVAAGDAAPDASGGAAELTSLSIAPALLTPEFSPKIHDYTAPCGKGTNTWNVVATVGDGAKLTIGGEEAPGNALPVELTEDQALVVRVTAGAAQSEYWVRCLPEDFPVIWATVPPAGQSRTPGWYVVGSALAQNGYGPYAMILDGNGVPVWYHHGKAGLGVIDVDSPAPGAVSFMNGLGPFGRDSSGQFDLHVHEPWGSSAIKSVTTPTDPHELVSLSNGHHLVFTYSPTVLDLTGLGTYGPNTTIADCEIQELDADGARVWRWRASDHFDPVTDSSDYGAADVDGVPYADVFHCNSIQPDADGNLLVSARHMDAVFLVDRVTGLVRWKLGGSKTNKDDARILDFVGETEKAFFHQHDARFLPNGHLTLFDNHSSQFGVARGVEYALDLDLRTATLVYEVRDSVSSFAMGSFRRAEDGTSVVGWGWPADGYGHVLTELDAAGTPLFDVAFAKGNLSYRAVKVPLAQFDRDVLRRTAGMP